MYTEFQGNRQIMRRSKQEPLVATREVKVSVLCITGKLILVAFTLRPRKNTYKSPHKYAA